MAKVHKLSTNCPPRLTCMHMSDEVDSLKHGAVCCVYR